jgi:hypothetical protein
MWSLASLLRRSLSTSPRSRRNYHIVLLLYLLTLSGCVTDQYCIPTGCSGPERLLPVNQELAFIAINYDYSQVLSRYLAEPSLEGKKAIRNEFIFERIYAMDVKYTIYEDSLTKESQSEGFWAAVTNAALTGTGALIPVAQTTRLLSGIAAGLTTVDQAYNKQFMYNKAVQILQAQMRARRADIHTQIIVRARFPVTEYPLGMAMIDLEEYYRAGTLSSACVDLSVTIGTDANSKRKVKELLKGGVVTPDPGIKAPVFVRPALAVGTALRESTPRGTRDTLPGAGGQAGGPKPEDKVTGGKTEVERDLPISLGQQIQGNLCVSVANGHFGTETREGAETREAIRQAKLGANQSRSARRAAQLFPAPVTNQIDSKREAEIFVDAKHCEVDRSGIDRAYATSFEKFRFADDILIKELQRALAKCDKNVTESGLFDTATRAGILAATSKPGSNVAKTDRLNDKSYEWVSGVCI